jgi:glycosyltransferase involved in cell wall biosynthesis
LSLVTTIIPVYNRPGLLRDAVQSVLDQTHRPIEIIIVDDESTDDTPECIGQLVASHPDIIRSAWQKNCGPGIARETGRLLARGEFIQYLDSDDVLLPRKFEVQVRALKENPEAGAAYCFTRYRVMGEEPHPTPWKRSGITVETMFPTFLDDRWWDTPTPLYRKSVLDEAGPWTDLRLEEDWEYDCRIASLGTRLVHCKEFLVEVRDHAGTRLCCGDPYDKKRLHWRSAAHQLILGHARRFGLDVGDPHMQRFSRKLFLLARQCGAGGLTAESKALVELSKSSADVSKRGHDLRTYELLARCVGWKLMGQISCLLDKLKCTHS